MQVRTSHVRHRHPQENISTELLEVPSPIDEDEVPTPPSAAEAAGSQLSMLTVNDMDMEPSHERIVPTISVDPSQILPFDQRVENSQEVDSAIADGFEPMDSAVAELVRTDQVGVGAHKRGFSMGFRADCEKCQMRVPGHMNHFVT